MDTPRILVLSGGISTEREISLNSGANVARFLESAGYTVKVGDPSQDKLEDLVVDIDVVLPILHGKGGEDGAVQQELEELGVKYLGSTPVACQNTFDKAYCKQILSNYDIKTPQGEIVTKSTFEASDITNGPFVLKPNDGGSSIDMILTHDPAGLYDREQAKNLFEKYPNMLLEELIVGQEITVGVLGNAALPVIEIIPPTGKEFDFDNKYNGATQEITNPKTISEELQDQAKQLALKVHEVTGCRHLSRTDMIITNNGDMYVLEINTMPGMTEQSLFPKAAAAHGISMTELAKQFVSLSTEQ